MVADSALRNTTAVATSTPLLNANRAATWLAPITSAISSRMKNTVVVSGLPEADAAILKNLAGAPPYTAEWFNKIPAPRTSSRSALVRCMGNICRSPTAEGVFRHKAREAELLDRLLIDSAERTTITQVSRRTRARKPTRADGAMTLRAAGAPFAQ